MIWESRSPQPLSIVGFDGIPLSSMTTPRLTTVKQPIQRIAAAAVAVLLNKQPTPGVGHPILLDCELAEGETTLLSATRLTRPLAGRFSGFRPS